MQRCYSVADLTQQDNTIIIAMLLLLSSIVIADPNSGLNLPDNFSRLTVDDVLTSDDNWREPEEEENEWRKAEEKTTTKPSREVRWGAQIPYENDAELDPIVSPSENQPSGVVKTPEITPQFQLRF